MASLRAPIGKRYDRNWKKHKLSSPSYNDVRVIFLKTFLRFSAVILMIATSFYLWSHPKKNEDKTEPVKPVKEETKTEAKMYTVKLHRSDGSEVTLDLEEYLEGVAARTFAANRGFEVDDTTSSQVYQDESQLKQVWAESYDERKQKVHEAVSSTCGEVMKYQGEIITAPFFSSSPGKTANSQEYWKGETPYLKSVESPWDDQVNEGNTQRAEFDILSFSQALGFQNPVTEIGQPVYYDSGYVKEITIDQITFSGRKIREALKLRSSCFEMQRNKDTIVITTKGFGHGIGMSQYGAQGMALEGYDYKEILKHYYTGIEIVSLDE